MITSMRTIPARCCQGQLHSQFDNSDKNPLVVDPDQWITFGARSVDAMSNARMSVTNLTEAEYERLVEERMQFAKEQMAKPKDRHIDVWLVKVYLDVPFHLMRSLIPTGDEAVGPVDNLWRAQRRRHVQRTYVRDQSDGSGVRETRRGKDAVCEGTDGKAERPAHRCLACARGQEKIGNGRFPVMPPRLRT